MSKFIRKLKGVTESAVPAMGFRAASATAKARGPLLLAILSHADAKSAKSAVAAGADALVIRTQDSSGAREFAQAVADVPCGLLIKSGAVDAAFLKESGLDFVAFAPVSAPASVLRAEGLGKIAVISASAEMESLRGMDRVGVDCLLLEPDVADFLSVQYVMTCCFLSGATNKPLMATVSDSAMAEDIGALWDAGVDGFAVESGPSRIQELRKVIASLPPRAKRKSGKDIPLLPRLGNGAPVQEEDEREDDE